MDDQTPVQEPQRVAHAPKQSGNSLAIPAAIVIGFGLIAAAIFFSGGTGPVQLPGTDTQGGPDTQATGEMRPVDENDHVRGNPNAPILMVEYSDYDCPFCKNFHDTMSQVMDTYGTDGKVAWVYRHFPLESLHPNAPYLAMASECVAELGGNEAFWTFTDLIFGERSANEPTNTARLTEFAETAGVSASAFDACVADGHTKALVEEDFNDGISVGAKGTPYTVVLVGGQRIVINGAQKYETVSRLLDTIIAQMENTAE